MVTEHFRVRFVDKFLQSLKAAYVKNILFPEKRIKGSPTPYLLSSVLDMTFWLSTTRQSKQRRCKVSYPQRRFFVRTLANRFKRTTYAFCIRVDINYEFAIDHGATKRSFWVLVVREEEARDFSVYIVPVDLQQYEGQMEGKVFMGVRCKQSAHSFPGW